MDKSSRECNPLGQEDEVAGHSSEVGMSTGVLLSVAAYLVQDPSPEIGAVHIEHGLCSSFILF